MIGKRNGCENRGLSPIIAANFTDALANMSVASTMIGGTCAGVTNTPALGIGATALNLTIPSLPVGSCTITVSLTSSTVGTLPLTTSGVATTETPVAGAGSNTTNLTVRATPYPATIASAFIPAWIAQAGTSTLTFNLGSPSALPLTNATFTDTLSNVTLASATIGGSCASVTNSPALAVGASALNLTVPTLPATGCTITVQVTSAVLGSNANATSGVTSLETTAGAPPNTIYLTVSVADVGFSYVHADHLGTPRAITRPSDNSLVWKWENTDPFGNNAPNEDPSATGTAFKYNLRFPGQYYDQETGTHYNWNRDYDAATGRYIQSDPIGLDGGINTYAYVKGSPLKYVDPDGLQLVLPMPGPALGGASGTCTVCRQPKAETDSLGLTDGNESPTFSMPNTFFMPPELVLLVAGVSLMAAPGNQADTQITGDYGRAASDAKLNNCPPPDRCKWQEENASRYRPDQVKATQKAWGCRGSRPGKDKIKR